MQLQPRIVDLFCGCGGFSLGAHSAGFKTAVAFDIDSNLTASQSNNFPNTTLSLADISTLTGADIKREIGEPVDGVIGGPPCQAFSSIGRRIKNDPRRSLLGHFYRLVGEIDPAFFIMENVKGLGYTDALPVLEDAISTLPSKYAIVGPIVLDAADFGAATKRERLFVIGYDPERMEPLSEEDIDGAKTEPTTVRDAIGDLAGARQIEDEDDFDVWKLDGRKRVSAYAARMLNEDGTFTGHLPTVHSSAVIERFEKVEQGGIDRVGRHPRLDWDGQCPTLRAGTGSDHGSYQSVRPIHPVENRVITVREAARLQGFPDSFRFHPTKWHSFRMIGNSVSPIISEALFKLIKAQLKVPQLEPEPESEPAETADSEKALEHAEAAE